MSEMKRVYPAADMPDFSMPEGVRQIIQTLYDHGYEAYAVGGCVRDILLGRTPNDWDITTSARPQEVKKLFRRTIDTGIQHGTVTIMLGKEGYEVTTYRIDGEYEDARHPKEVTFTSNLVEDLKRRDFTINAMAYNEIRGLVDAFDGVGDLQKGIIRCVGVPEERFGEDALRMLRAVRFAAQLGFAIEENTAEAIRKLAPTIAKVSAERIQMELVKLLTSSHPDQLRTAWELGLTGVFLPEWDRMMETGQRNPHHAYSVGEHTLKALTCSRPDRILRLALLFHDVAKPVCLTRDAEGVDHFHGHPQKGARMAADIFRRLKFDNETIDRCCALISWHDDMPPLSPANVRRAINRIGLEQYPLIFELRRADVMGQSDYLREEKLRYIDDYEQIYRKCLEDHDCLTKKDLAINGRDLIALGMKPGKELGEVLEKLFQAVLKEPALNCRECLLEMAEKSVNSLTS